MKKSKLLSYVNKQAIREVLGSLLQEPSLIREYKIVQNDFPETFHKLIFAAINNLYKNPVIKFKICCSHRKVLTGMT